MASSEKISDVQSLPEESVKDIEGISNVKDIEGIPQTITHIPVKESWQKYSSWRVNIIKSNLYVYYSGASDGSIWVTKNSLVNVLKAVQSDKQAKQEKTLYQFQNYSPEYITRSLNSRRGSQNENLIPFRFIRASLQKNNALIFQNTFSVKPNSIEVDKLYQSLVIQCTLDQLLAPLEHISTPSMEVKYTHSTTFENDID